MIGLSLGAAKPNALRQPNRPVQEVILVTAAEGKLASATGNRTLTITLAAPHPLAGSYRIEAESLAAGPLCLVPPTIIGEGSGKALRVQPGLWACNPALGAAEFALSWMAGEVILAGEADSTLVLTQGLEGQAIRHAETLYQGTLKGVSIAAPVQIPKVQPEPEPRLAVIHHPDATLTATVQDGEVTITVTAPPEYAGSYTVQTADFAAGPVWLKAPVLAYPYGLGIGKSITATPGLVVNNADHGAIGVASGWHRGDTPISGAAALTYIVTQADQGHDLTYRQVASDGAGLRPTRSLAASVPLPSTKDRFIAPSETKLTAYVGESGLTWGTPNCAVIRNGRLDPTDWADWSFQGRGGDLGPDQFVEADVVYGGHVDAGVWVGLCISADGNSGYGLRHNGRVWGFFKRVGGGAGWTGNSYEDAQPVGATGRVRVERRGANLSIILNGTLVHTVTDADLTGGRIGIAARGNNDTTGMTLTSLDGGSL